MTSALINRVATAVDGCSLHRRFTGEELDEYLRSILHDITTQRARPLRTLPPDIAKAFGTRNQGEPS